MVRIHSGVPLQKRSIQIQDVLPGQNADGTSELFVMNVTGTIGFDRDGFGVPRIWMEVTHNTGGRNISRGVNTIPDGAGADSYSKLAEPDLRGPF